MTQDIDIEVHSWKALNWGSQMVRMREEKRTGIIQAFDGTDFWYGYVHGVPVAACQSKSAALALVRERLAKRGD